MSTICTCKNSGVKTGFACNYSEGCPFVTPKDAIDGVAREVEKIAVEWNSKMPVSKTVKYLFGDSVPAGGIYMELPNGDSFKFRYDAATGYIVVNKMSDSMRTGAINIQPGGATNQILIK